MVIVSQVTDLLQGLLEESMDALARETGCVRRERKFSGATLLSTLVLTVLQHPKPRLRNYQNTAAQLGVDVTENAIAQRFTPSLVQFLELALKRVLEHTLTADAPGIELLDRFTEVVIGDSTTVALPDEYAEQFPGCGGSHGSGKAAMKIQVLWDLSHGRLQIILEPGRASDAKSPITELPLPAGSLAIFDLGYFSLDRFERVETAGGFWLSRLQHGTTVCDTSGNPLLLPKFLAKNAQRGIVDVSVAIGAKRLPCRLLAVRVSAEIAARRRQKIREKARDHGREPSREYLDLQEWTIYVTNCPPTLLKWKEVVVLYRARWQVERLFKLWKSYNCLAARDENATAARQVAEVYVKIIAVIIQHGILLMTVWLDGRRSLWRAAARLRDWMAQIIGVIDDAAKLQRVLVRQSQIMAKSSRLNSRKKHPNCFQLLNNPELLEYIVA
ncbi:MAG: IS4 family transposase [Planctomycetaceae bacterium]|nr:MAG: IS4 family transposase [Planctomycetaceae bacterium]